MGFHHLYCIPQGYDARDGAYVRYNADEHYAILSLESHRSQTLIVGEDLGTVPRYVRPAMRRHAVHRSYVGQFQLRPDRDDALPQAPALSVASLNTHDTPTFAAFWEGLGIDDRLDLGLLTPEDAAVEQRSLARLREAVVAYLRNRGLLRRGRTETADVLRALLVAMGRGPARLVLANLEDLWLEKSPQNVPGTTDERVNWRRKMRLSLGEVRQSNEVRETLQALRDSRRRRRK
jgi:4-alpha-glucanotransferase